MENQTNVLLGVKPNNEAESNDWIQIALQDLYAEMRKADVIDPVGIMEDHDPPETIPEQRDLVVRKICGLQRAIAEPTPV